MAALEKELSDAGLTRELIGSIMSKAVGIGIASDLMGKTWMMSGYVEKAIQDEHVSPQPAYMSLRAYDLLPYAHHLNALRSGSDVGTADTSPDRKAMEVELAAREAQADKEIYVEPTMADFDDIETYSEDEIRANRLPLACEMDGRPSSKDPINDEYERQLLMTAQDR